MKNNIYNITIEELFINKQISRRMYNIFCFYQIHDLQQLSAITQYRLNKWHNCGINTILQIKLLLKKHNLKLFDYTIEDIMECHQELILLALNGPEGQFLAKCYEFRRLGNKLLNNKRLK